MHGLINRTIQCFLSDTYGTACWKRVADRAGLGFSEFESMLHYDAAVTGQVVDAASSVLVKPREALFEDIGTYLVSHPNRESLRRLLRFGGVDFLEFLHSLDDLPDRARLAVPDIDLPSLELRDVAQNRFAVLCAGSMDGFGHVLVGVLRAMADDYGALVILDHEGRSEEGELVTVTLVEQAYAEGRQFLLTAPQRDRRDARP